MHYQYSRRWVVISPPAAERGALAFLSFSVFGALSPPRVSGSSETKTYGKSAMAREHEE